ncbi:MULTISPECIES: GNAT family N-acetyltransferase [unclassified Gilliamella]|uniref:GNAT family N-acetyltransferase n=1 Tax=unclassified Gilliamella TaxID=2685620 RepID=UPI002269C2EA|nr:MULTISPECIES: GNAT family N-acetyltransferase [unclassified Gilliamella]MCX8575208.1 GNAT family N-acetyltransferase [Gilliamella sp. B3831]MCX8577591.1 GNAT family N-acetyltransferase [Gilliamella sp. B3815]MCX8590271.1 GNAT family N-acetyltransferase [Gilliamella sp. B3812]MCX8604541.1 GNAT family N-acetyltransferase [Gilliamella sp. B3823]MCX8605645.1 GNAT family N-acetyltransferase [Gilliamella sp. B3825]
MSIVLQQHCQNINWQDVADLLAFYGLSSLDAKTQEQVFKQSYGVVFLLEKKRVVGVGRTLSDGICQAAIYNIALANHLHGQQFGRLIVEKLVEQVKHCNIILYTHPQTIEFYKNMGFDLMKTGMARYQVDHRTEMKNMGFI